MRDHGIRPKILVSACLMGLPVRYNGSAKPLMHDFMDRWRVEGRLVTICPELAGGFATPRPPAEIGGGRSGADVLAGTAHVIEATGRDVSALYVAGAKAALALAVETGCRYALLIDASPSCGSNVVYDGTFQGRKQPGEGVTAALLRQNGITVFSDSEIDDLARAVDGSSS